MVPAHACGDLSFFPSPTGLLPLRPLLAVLRPVSVPLLPLFKPCPLLSPSNFRKPHSISHSHCRFLTPKRQ